MDICDGQFATASSHGPLDHCVRATDEQGNVSPASCARLTLR